MALNEELLKENECYRLRRAIKLAIEMLDSDNFDLDAVRYELDSALQNGAYNLISKKKGAVRMPPSRVPYE